MPQTRLTKKSLLGRMLVWRNDTRALHTMMSETFGMTFPEDKLLAVVDSHLKIGGEGQARAYKKPRGSRPTRSGATMTEEVIDALTTKPLLAREIQSRMRSKNISASQIVKILARLYTQKGCRRSGSPGSYKYYLAKG